MAWIYRIHNYEGDFFKIEPSTCIKPFKNFIPYAGTLYGKLSKKTHISPLSTLDYIKADENKKLSLTLEDLKRTKHNAYMLLGLLDIYCLVGEYIYSDLITDFRFLISENNELVPSESRSSLKIIQKYKGLLLEEGKIAFSD